jgi:hypothetical protein
MYSDSKGKTMKATTSNPGRIRTLENRVQNPNREGMNAWLRQWRQKLRYVSIFAVIPAIVTSQAQEASADQTKMPEERFAEQTAMLLKRLKVSCTKPGFLKRQDKYRFSSQKGSFDILSVLAGNDNCPGLAIPAGTYTATAPYIDTGNTIGANNTVDNSGCYSYYYAQSHGADHIYSFSLTAIGPNPQIQVQSTLEQPYIYILDGQMGDRCPLGTGRFANNCRADSLWPGSGGNATIGPNYMNSLPLNAPLHLFIDSAGGPTGGAYTLRIQDVTIAPAAVLPPTTDHDFDGDGRADVSVFRPSDSVWYLNRSQAGPEAVALGSATVKLVPGDYDSDGKTDVAVFKPSEGKWYLLLSRTATLSTISWGTSSDIPVPGNYYRYGNYYSANIFRPSDGTWWIRLSDKWHEVEHFGQNGDIPVGGDYDGDGLSDISVFRPSTGIWYIRSSRQFTIWYRQWGLATDKVVPADYDGDTKTDIAVYRPSEGIWYIANSGGNPAHSIVRFGASEDIPVPADYDGDGKADIAIFRPADGNWWINRSSAGLEVIHWGQNGDRPVPAALQN